MISPIPNLSFLEHNKATFVQSYAFGWKLPNGGPWLTFMARRWDGPAVRPALVCWLILESGRTCRPYYTNGLGFSPDIRADF